MRAFNFPISPRTPLSPLLGGRSAAKPPLRSDRRPLRGPSTKSKFLAIGILLGTQVTGFGIVVFMDDFNRADSTTVGGPAGQLWTEVEPWSDCSISSSQLRMSYSGGISDRPFVYQDTSNFTSPYNTALSSNTGPVVWSFNMRQSFDDPTGYFPFRYDAGFILGSTSADAISGQGYAVILENGTSDRLALARYADGTDGDHHFTTLASWENGDADAYFNVKVVYTPATNLWELYATADSFAFSDPLSATTLRGSTTDSTYTADALGYMGAFALHGGDDEIPSGEPAFEARFDNVTVQVVPEPATAAAFLLGLGLMAGRRRR